MNIFYTGEIMRALSLLLTTFLFTILLAGCGSSNMGTRGNPSTAKWLKTFSQDAVVRKKASPKKVKTYKLKINVLVAEENRNGNPWDPDRTELPDLRLYYIADGVTGTGKRLIGKKDNSLTIFGEHPLSLKGEDNITLRLVDEDVVDYRGYEYGHKNYNDSYSKKTQEVPLAQLNLKFEGQGRYIYFSGSSIFAIDFVELSE